MSAPVKAIVCFNICAQDDDAIGLGEAIALGEAITLGKAITLGEERHFVSEYGPCQGLPSTHRSALSAHPCSIASCDQTCQQTCQKL